MGRRLPAVGRDWHSALRARGYRLTPQRQLVLEAVAALGHATPEDISAKVRETASGVNISTVYRTVELLEQLGLVRHTHLGHGAPAYSVATDDDHVHLVCRDCGGVEEVEPEVVAETVARLGSEHGFAVDVGHLTVFGRCQACREHAGPTVPPGAPSVPDEGTLLAGLPGGPDGGAAGGELGAAQGQRPSP